jgi:hypothetical protein
MQCVIEEELHGTILIEENDFCLRIFIQKYFIWHIFCIAQVK